MSRYYNRNKHTILYYIFEKYTFTLAYSAFNIKPFKLITFETLTTFFASSSLANV